MSLGINLAEKGYIPDLFVRIAMRRLLRKRLAQEKKRRTSAGKSELIDEMRKAPLAINSEDANEQHYEVPTSFFELMLGPRMKYSCALFDEEESLEEAEESMLSLCCTRAEVEDGQAILELGCGWGSLSLYLAEHYPRSQVCAVSNSETQRAYIEDQASLRNLENLSVITSDMNDFRTTDQFDRIVSIEMFEHMRNYQLLFQRISGWLKQDGKLFFHIFCHKEMPYFFENESKDDWMAKNFFTGGIMPSFDLPARFNDHLEEEKTWEVNGMHYAKTCRQWLKNIDQMRSQALKVMGHSENPDSEVVLFNRWRMFVMACEELFACNEGKEWHVGHYLFVKR